MTWTTRPRSDLAGLSAIVAGQGRPIILIHGVGLRAEAWGAQVEALTRAHRVVAVDMPDHGSSPHLDQHATLRAFVDPIAAVLDLPENREAVVIGHSFGAMIALDLAARYGGLVSGVVALNAIYRRDAAAQSAVQARAETLDGATIADPSAPLARWFGTPSSAERSACEHWLTACDPAGYRAAYRVFATENGPAESALATLACPALFMTGENERNSTPAMSRAMAGLAPHGRAIVIDGAAHMLPMTHPVPVNAALLEFVQECFA
ncbi:MAG: alpha/beta hydrolase [Pseudomonadota bacterium]